MLKATQLISDETVTPSHIRPHSPGSQWFSGLVAWEKTFPICLILRQYFSILTMQVNSQGAVKMQLFPQPVERGLQFCALTQVQRCGCCWSKDWLWESKALHS